MPTEWEESVTVEPTKLVVAWGWTSKAGSWAKLPVSDRLETMVSERGLAVPVAALAHPVKTQPAAGVAVTPVSYTHLTLPTIYSV